MECRFVYSPREMHAAIASYRSVTLLRTLMRTAILWLILGGLAAFTINDEMRSTVEHPNPSLAESVITMWPLLLIPVLYTIYFFTPIWGYVTAYSFRKNPLCNQEVLYSVVDDGLTLQSAVLSQQLAWVTVEKAGEGKLGFVLFWGKSKRRFNWLPKHGFASEADITACRELLRKKVANFKEI